MKHRIITLFIILGILIISVGCSDENKEDKKHKEAERAKFMQNRIETNPNDDVPVP